MNTKRKSIIFAAVLGVILSANPMSTYAHSLNADSNIQAELLAGGHEVEFSSFVKDNLTKYSQKADWAQVEKIVTQYNQNPSQLHKLSADDKVAFEKAVKTLNKRLMRLSDQKGQEWASDLNSTAKQIRFIWNFDLESLTPGFIETPLPVAPATVKAVM